MKTELASIMIFQQQYQLGAIPRLDGYQNIFSYIKNTSFFGSIYKITNTHDDPIMYYPIITKMLLGLSCEDLRFRQIFSNLFLGIRKIKSFKPNLINSVSLSSLENLLASFDCISVQWGKKLGRQNKISKFELQDLKIESTMIMNNWEYAFILNIINFLEPAFSDAH